MTAGMIVVIYNIIYFRKFSRHPEKYSFAYRYQIIRKMVLYILKCFRVDLYIDGYEKFSDLQRKSMIFENHLSDADPLIIIALSSRPISVVSKKEAFSYPFIKNALRALDAFSLDRENLMNQISQIRDMVAYLKDEKRPNLLLYPEGTRNRKPEEACLSFHGGSLKICKIAGVDILPIVSFGASRIFTTKSYLKRYPVFIKICDPINYSKMEKFDSNEEAKNLRKFFDQEIDKLRSLDYKEINSRKLSQKKKELETRIDIKRMS